MHIARIPDLPEPLMSNKCCQPANNGNLVQNLSIAAALMTAAKAQHIESHSAARGNEAEGAHRRLPRRAIVMQCVCVIGRR